MLILPKLSLASIAFVQCQKAEDTTATLHTTWPVNITTTAGNFLIVCTREGLNNTDNFTVNDNATQGNWFQSAGGYFVDAGATSRKASAFYMPTSKALTTVTVNYTTGGGVSLVSLIACEFSGISFVDADVISQSASGTTFTTGALTTTQPNDLAVVCAEFGGAVTSVVAGSGYTVPSNGSLTRIGLEYKILSATQSGVTTTMTWGTAQASAGDYMSWAQTPAPIYQSILGSGVIGGGM